MGRIKEKKGGGSRVEAEGRVLKERKQNQPKPGPPCPCPSKTNNTSIRVMLFFSFFKTLIGKTVAVELKNDVILTGTLHSCDQYLNLKLSSVSVVNSDKYPQLGCLKNAFVRGSVVRYVQIPSGEVDTELLEDATRKENAPKKREVAKAK
ncbi:hypothetical protein TrRE_jg5309 [Triparma retinervis]|uniref:Sm domain-containing protein n=1 Tax=Triparma retinervis TaxID=2557542 RepID=A0A9W7CC05_9STRA|nr:hypothetical protein TrRE_jg5309 [Triparma retinervis]